MKMFRQIVARLEAIEIIRRRGLHLEDVRDEGEAKTPKPKPKEEQDEERLFKALARENSRPTFELSTYNRKLDIDALLDWIFEIETILIMKTSPKIER